MKRFLLALACLAFGFEAYAANPSFSSFATNQFITNNFLIRSRLNPFQFDTNASSVTITNLGSLAGTNNFNTIVVSNLYTTNLFFSTNIVTYVTNLYVTNIVVDNITIITNGTIAGTNIASMADLVWTNELGNIRPTGLQNSVTATNIIGNERLTAAGAFMLQALIDYALDAGLNDISAYTNSVIWIEGFDSDPANSSVRLNMGNGQGHILVIQNNANGSGFTMRNGEPLFASPPGAVQRLNGDWVTSTKGDALMLYNNGTSGWSEIGRMAASTNNLGSGLWERVGGVLRPLAFSSNTNKFTIAETTGWSGTGTNAFMDNGTFEGMAMINPTDGALAYRVNAYELGDSPWHLNGTDVETFSNATVGKTIVVGTNTISNYGPVNGETIVSIRDVAAGETDYNSVFLQVINGANSSKIVMDLGSAGGTQMLQEKTTVAGTRSLNVANGSSMRIIGADGITGQNLFRLDPDVPDNTTAYQLNTSNTHTLGDLLEVQNNGTTNFTIAAVSGYDGSGTHFLSDDGTYKTGSDIGLWTNKSGILQPLDLTLPVRITNRIEFDNNGSSFLVKDNGGMRFTDTNTSSRITLNTAFGIGGFIQGFNNGGSQSIQISSPGAAALAIGSGNVALNSFGFVPSSANTIDLGMDGVEFRDIWMKRTNHIVGYQNGSDYSRLSINHSGTNGAIVFDSQSAGVAGPPKPYVFQIGETNMMFITVSPGSGIPALSLTNPISGGTVSMEVNAGSEGQISSSSGFLRLIGATILQGNILAVVTDNFTDIGSNAGNGAFKNFWQKGSHYVEGYNNGAGNESWLQVQHTGATNGVIEFTSHATVGGNRPFRFNGADVILGNSHTPASSSETNYVGAMTWDANYIYVWTATNVNKRATLNAW